MHQFLDHGVFSIIREQWSWLPVWVAEGQRCCSQSGWGVWFGRKKYSVVELGEDRAIRDTLVLQFFVLSQIHSAEDKTLKAHHPLPLSRMLWTLLMGALLRAERKLGLVATFLIELQDLPSVSLNTSVWLPSLRLCYYRQWCLLQWTRKIQRWAWFALFVCSFFYSSWIKLNYSHLSDLLQT